MTCGESREGANGFMTPDVRPSDLSLLLVEDNPGDVDLLREHVREAAGSPPDLQVAGTLDDALRLLEEHRFDAVLLDLNLPDSAGLETLDRALRANPETPVIVLTGAAGEDTWIETVQRGAADFLPKDGIDGDLLLRSVRYAMERARRHRIERRFRALIENARDLVTILDEDLTIRYVSPSLQRILGFDPDEKIGDVGLLEVHPADQERVGREAARVLEDPSYSAHLQYRVRHEDGSWRILDTVAENHLADPSIRGVVVNSWDVTDLVRTEKELDEATSRLQVLQSVSATANEARTLREAMEVLVGELPRRLSWDVCRAYEVEGDEVRALPLSYVRGEVVVDGAPAAGGGGPGLEALTDLVRAALASGQVEQRRVASSGNLFEEAGGPDRMEAGIAIPVPAGEGVVGVLELLTVRHDGDDDALRDLAGQIGTQLERVAERERALRRIRESRNLLQELVEGVPDAMFLKDREGRYTLVNEAAAELIGQSRDAVIGMTDRDLFQAESAGVILRPDRGVVEEGRILNEEEELVDSKGRTRTYLVTKGPIRDSEGRITGMFGTARDVTELKEAQAALRERVKELRTLYKASRELSRTDRPLEDRLETLVRLLPDGWLHPEITEARIRYGDRTFRTAGFRETSWMLSSGIEPDGETAGRLDVVLVESRPEKDLGPFLEEEQELLDALSILVGEAIERERLEEEFIHAQKMEAVGRLSGGIAHDFNNLLTVIRAHTDFLLLDLPEGDPLAEDVRAVGEAADQAADLTAQLLAFGKEQVLQPRILDMNEVVESIRRLGVRVLGEDIRVELRLAEDLPPIEADPGQLEQALLNLAVNARDAMPEGGTLTFSTELEEIGSKEAEGHAEIDPGRYVRLTVADTGVGMDDETREKVFEPFFSTKGREKGTGLGLAMVYGIVTQSGGWVHVESAPGEGARFTLRFPVAHGEPEAVDEEQALSPKEVDEVGGRVLVVEDDGSVRRVARAILERAGFDVRAVSDAEAGLAILGEGDGNFDVLLTDLVLPGMGGRELIDQVRKEVPGMPLVAMSGYAEDSPGRRRDLPAEIYFLQKPFSTEALGEVVRRAIARRRS